jgi:hypothetical protein
MLATLSIFSFTQVPQNILAAITDTDVIDITAVVPSPNTGGSGSGSGSNSPVGTVTISGYSFPNAKITLLKDGWVVTSLVANSDGTFEILVNSLNLGNYQFSMYSEDKDGITSSPVIVNVSVYQPIGYSYQGVIIPPTIQTNTTTVGSGQTLSVYGYAAPGATVFIDVPGLRSMGSAIADATGFYRFEVRDQLAAGVYNFRTRAQIGTETSAYSKPVAVQYFKGTVPPSTPPTQLGTCVDYNHDRRVNLIDFSILLFWYNKPDPPKNIDCNSDNRIDIRDFSVLMYFWTG